MSESSVPSLTVEAGPASQPRASAAAAGHHPCLIGNNSTNHRTPSGWKSAVLVKIAVLQMVEKWGAENIGMYTFTFTEDIGYKEASRRWNSFNTHVLSKRLNGDWVKVLELTKRGRPHYHVILCVPGIGKDAVITRLATKRDRSGEGIKWRWMAKGQKDSVLWG